MKLEGLKINFLGDSITQGIGPSCPENIQQPGYREHRHHDCTDHKDKLTLETVKHPHTICGGMF